MAPRLAHRQVIRKRQLPGATVAPTATGIAGAVTMSSTANGLNTLALNFDSSAAVDPAAATVPLVAESPNITLTVSASNSPTSTSDPTASSDAASADSAAAGSSSPSSDISMGTVIGACLGALVGAIILITVAYCIYKRSTPKRKAANSRTPVAATRNVDGEIARKGSKRETWDKLGEGVDAANEDTWEGKYPETKEADAFSEKLSLGGTKAAARAPSIKTVATHKSESAPVFDLGPHPFGQYAPNMVLNVEEHPLPMPLPTRTPAPEPTQYLDVDLNNSWTGRISGTVSDTSQVARPTPNVTPSAAQVHYWESAEVVHMDEDFIPEKSNNPFASNTSGDNRKSSGQNPFFGGGGPIRPLKTSPPKPSLKGKERMLTPSTEPSRNPFDDANARGTPISVEDVESFEPEPVPTITHTATGSVSSAGSSSGSERALQNLIAALDLSPEEVQERLRVTSMQPSIISNASYYTEEVTGAFPLPPEDGIKP